MVNSENAKAILDELQFDIRRWKSLITHMENETVFINRLLNQEPFDTVVAPTIVKRISFFKKHIKSKENVLMEFKKEINDCQKKIEGILQEKEMLNDISYVGQHNSIKGRFEKFCKDFRDFRVKVLLQAGSTP